MPPVDAVSPRKAALLLHALPESAREQVLQQLSDSQRSQVVNLLGELQALGIPQDRDWLSLVEQDVGAAMTVWAQASALHAGEVAAALQGQPVATTSAVLGMRDWPWRAGVMAVMPVEQRIRVNALLGEHVALTEAVERALLARLLKQVSLQHHHPSAPQAPRSRMAWYRRFFQ